jgi:hypothetical protein
MQTYELTTLNRVPESPTIRVSIEGMLYETQDFRFHFGAFYQFNLSFTVRSWDIN